MKKYESELLKEVSKQGKELLENERVKKITKELLQNITKEKSLKNYLKNSNIKLERLERIKESYYVHTVLEIHNSIFENKNEWYNSFKDSKHYKKVMSILEPLRGVGSLIFKNHELKKFENNSDYFYYQLLESKNSEYSTEIRMQFSNNYKNLLSGYPKLNKFINDSVHDINNSHNEREILLFGEVQKLEKDRIYLYELSKKVSDETKFKVIIDGISKGKFELPKLKNVEKYLFNKIADSKIKRSPVKQIVEYIYKELKDLGGKTFDKTYIQKIIYGIKKGYKKIPTKMVK